MSAQDYYDCIDRICLEQNLTIESLKIQYADFRFETRFHLVKHKVCTLRHF